MENIASKFEYKYVIKVSTESFLNKHLEGRFLFLLHSTKPV